MIKYKIKMKNYYSKYIMKLLIKNLMSIFYIFRIKNRNTYKI